MRRDRLRFGRHSFDDAIAIADRAHDLASTDGGPRPTTPFQALERASAQDDYQALSGALEGARDCAQTVLDGRGEDRLSKEALVRAIVLENADRAWERAQAALSSGVIPPDLAHGVGWLVLSIAYITNEGRMRLAAERFRLEDYL